MTCQHPACTVREMDEETNMPELKGSKTHQNLLAAFAGEAQANRRYLYFARQADIEGCVEAAKVFRATSDGETGHAFGHLDHLSEVGDPASGKPIGETKKNLEAAVAGETYEFSEMYPQFAAAAREEGFEKIARWFDTLAKAEKAHAARFQKALEEIG